jgi:hypothetical protein
MSNVERFESKHTRENARTRVTGVPRCFVWLLMPAKLDRLAPDEIAALRADKKRMMAEFDRLEALEAAEQAAAAALSK